MSCNAFELNDIDSKSIFYKFTTVYEVEGLYDVTVERFSLKEDMMSNRNQESDASHHRTTHVDVPGDGCVFQPCDQDIDHFVAAIPVPNGIKTSENVLRLKCVELLHTQQSTTMRATIHVSASFTIISCTGRENFS